MRVPRPSDIELPDPRQVAIYRGMTGNQRTAVAADLWRLGRSLVEAGERCRHPELDAPQLARRVAEHMGRGND